jgi:hypothetical protein
MVEFKVRRVALRIEPRTVASGAQCQRRSAGGPPTGRLWTTGHFAKGWIRRQCSPHCRGPCRRRRPRSNGLMARSLVRALRGPAATRDDAYARFALNHQPEDGVAFRAFERSHFVPVSDRRDAYERSLDIARDALGLDIHGLFLLSVLHAPNTKAGVNPWVKFGGRKNPASTL